MFYPLLNLVVTTLKANNTIQIIGTRHGEKSDETLLTREEKAKCTDRGSYFQVPADNRDLNYKKFFIEGEHKVEKVHEYTSSNTERLSVDQIIEKLMTVSYVKDVLAGNEPISA